MPGPGGITVVGEILSLKRIMGRRERTDIFEESHKQWENYSCEGIN